MQRKFIMTAGLLCWLLQASSASTAGPTFPWHSHSTQHQVAGQVPVRVLAPPATTPIEVQTAKQAYPYGWFGAKNTAQWKRSFGSSRAFTQWSRY